MNITKEEVQQILADLEMHTPYSERFRGQRSITLLQSKLAEPAHTDHPMRNYDRTCPACREDAEPVAYLWQHCETGRTRIVMPDAVITTDATWFVVGPLFTHPAKQVPSAALQLVNRQAEDEGLWFEAVTAPEAYLQAALRKLHAAVESSQKQVPMTEGEIDDLASRKYPGVPTESLDYVLFARAVEQHHGIGEKNHAL